MEGLGGGGDRTRRAVVLGHRAGLPSHPAMDRRDVGRDQAFILPTSIQACADSGRLLKVSVERSLVFQTHIPLLGSHLLFGKYDSKLAITQLYRRTLQNMCILSTLLPKNKQQKYTIHWDSSCMYRALKPA